MTVDWALCCHKFTEFIQNYRDCSFSRIRLQLGRASMVDQRSALFTIIRAYA